MFNKSFVQVQKKRVAALLTVSLLASGLGVGMSTASAQQLPAGAKLVSSDGKTGDTTYITPDGLSICTWRWFSWRLICVGMLICVGIK
jgi:hypothetical protein